MTKDQLQSECLKAIKNRKYSGAVLGTGAGKTLLGLKHMASLYNETATFLVVVPKLPVIEEWRKQAIEHDLVYLIESMEFTTYLSLYKQRKDYDFVYFDECHNAKKKHADWIRLYNGPVLGLTGTYPRYISSEAGQASAEFFPKVFEYNINTAISDNLLNNYKIYIHKLELSTKKTISTRKGSMSEEAHYNMHCNFVNNARPSEVMMKRIMRMKAMQAYDTKVNYAKLLLKQQTKKTLVFTDYTEQADKLCKNSYHAKNKDSKDNLILFQSGYIKKLSAVNQLSEGINIKDLEVGIILHSYANEKKLPQKIGRFLRLNPNDTAIIHILCYNNTVDVDWLKKALIEFKKEKIFKYDTTKTTHPA